MLAAGKYLLTDAGDKTQESIKQILECLSGVVAPGNPVDTRRLALVVIRTVSRHRNAYISAHRPMLVPSIFASVRDPVIPVKLAAEAAFLAVFSVVDEEASVFEKYMSSAATDMTAMSRKSMQDYFKRVALRLGSQARERREAEGGQGGGGLMAVERDDEREVWSIGKVDLGEGEFGDD